MNMFDQLIPIAVQVLNKIINRDILYPTLTQLVLNTKRAVAFPYAHPGIFSCKPLVALPSFHDQFIEHFVYFPTRIALPSEPLFQLKPAVFSA